MKILVVSLLRVGDLLMTAPALRDLRVRYSEARIDILVNSQSARAVPLLPTGGKTFIFDRDSYQKALGDPARPFFESFDRLSQLIDEINGEKYDLVINVTHTRLSGYLLSLIEAPEKNGLHIDAQMKPSFGSKWFRFLNEQVDFESKETFHFNDIFRNAMAVSDVASRAQSLRVTEAGRVEAARIFSDHALVTEPIIAVQALTSDEKKDWPLSSFAKAVSDLAVRHPEAAFAILAAPFEVGRLSGFASDLRDSGIKAFLAVVSLEGAAAILENSAMLLTGDTSIKHLAAGLGIKIVEIALGGSDPYRTGAYLQNAIVIRSREACAPCVHSRPCHRERRFCAERIPAEAVAMIASEVYSNRNFQISTVAREYEAEMQVLKADIQLVQRFELAPVVPEFSETSIARSVDRLCRTLWLSDVRRPIDGLGTETRRHWEFLKREYPTVSDFEWKHLFGAFETQVIGVEGRINSLKAGVKALNASFENQKSYQEFVRSLMHFREKIRPSPLLGLMLPLLDGLVEDDISPAFVKLRRLNDVINEIEARALLYRRVIRALDQSIESLLQESL